MKVTKHPKILSLSLAWLFSGGAHAAIVFTETIDLSDSLGSPFIFTEVLGIGANTFTGTLPASRGGSDVDVFQVSNPRLLRISSISISITNYVGTTTDPSRGSGEFQILLPNLGRKTITGDGFYPLNATLNESSQLKFRIDAPIDEMNQEYGSMNYQVTINAVPEPASSVLMATLALAGALRRKRNA